MIIIIFKVQGITIHIDMAAYLVDVRLDRSQMTVIVIIYIQSYQRAHDTIHHTDRSMTGIRRHKYSKCIEISCSV